METPFLSNLQRLKNEVQLRDYIGMIFRRKTVFVVSFLSVTLSTAFYVSQIRDIYESYSTVVIEEKNYAINQAMNYNNNAGPAPGFLPRHPGEPHVFGNGGRQHRPQRFQVDRSSIDARTGHKKPSIEPDP